MSASDGEEANCCHERIGEWVTQVMTVNRSTTLGDAIADLERLSSNEDLARGDGGGCSSTSCRSHRRHFYDASGLS
jgi:hypothetical protein